MQTIFKYSVQLLTHCLQYTYETFLLLFTNSNKDSITLLIESEQKRAANSECDGSVKKGRAHKAPVTTVIRVKAHKLPVV